MIYPRGNAYPNGIGGLRSKQGGVVLIMVLMIFSLVAILATAMLEKQSIDLERSTNQFVMQQSRAYAYAAEQAVRQGLFLDWESDNTKDSLEEEWAQERAFPLDPGSAQIIIRDAQSRFNLNTLAKDAPNRDQQAVRFRTLLNNLGLDTELAQQWQNWLDDESLSENDYLSLDVSYRAAYQPCSHPSELLLLLDLDQEDFNKLEPYVSCLPSNTALNVNTAGLVVLQSLDEEMDEAKANSIISSRAESGFTTIDDFWNITDLEPFTKPQQPENNNDRDDDNGEGDADSRNNSESSTRWDKSDFTILTEYFEVFVRVDLEDRIATSESLIHRDANTGAMTTLYRDFSRREIKQYEPSQTTNSSLPSDVISNF